MTDVTATGAQFVYLSLTAPTATAQAVDDVIAGWVSTSYTLTLTGTTDLELPLKSFTLRYSDGLITISCVCPGIESYVAGITARSNGKLVINRVYLYSDGSTSSYEMGRVNYNTIRTDKGARSGMTGVIGGTRQFSVTNQQTITLTGASIRNYDDSKRRYTCTIDPALRPGDTVLINDETIVVGEIAISVATKQATMTITEA
jgi:hypothetical protein